MAPEKEVDSNDATPTDDTNADEGSVERAEPTSASGAEPARTGTGAGPEVSSDEGAQSRADADVSAPGEADAADVADPDDRVVPINGADPSQAPDDNELGHDELLERLAAAEARADDNWDKFIRLQAEMENQRKRAQKEVSNARKFALEGMVEALLPIRDSLELGLKAADSEDANVASIREGSELTLKMLVQAFEKFNIEEVDPLDQKFDPEFHQAMSMQAVEGKAPNTVTGVLQKGYTLNDRLIRPALVMVAK